VCGEVDGVLKGLAADSGTMAAEVIRSVGAGGTYLAHPHTLRNFRSEHYLPSVFNRDTRGVWVSRGQADLRKKANAVARELLASHKPTPLDADVDSALEVAFRTITKRAIGNAA
jgi:trimethylamine--corrinoid protein Co-methyltransferase